MDYDKYLEKKWDAKALGKALGAIPEPFEEEGLTSAFRFWLPEAFYGANVALEIYINRDNARVVRIQCQNYSMSLQCRRPDIWKEEVEFRNDETGDGILLTRLLEPDTCSQQDVSLLILTKAIINELKHPKMKQWVQAARQSTRPEDVMVVERLDRLKQVIELALGNQTEPSAARKKQ